VRTWRTPSADIVRRSGCPTAPYHPKPGTTRPDRLLRQHAPFTPLPTHRPPQLDQPLLNASEAAGLLAVLPSWIYEAVRAGRVPCLKLGRHVRFTRAMLEDWLAEQAA
jgi:excisionase family DNA binding protein